MRHYTQLTSEERYQIYALYKIDLSQTAIARIIGRDKSTISRELKRNRGQRGYRPEQANRMARGRRKNKSHRRITSRNWKFVEALLREDWSPEQISGWLRNELQIRISSEWIYQHILKDKQNGGLLYHHLRCQKLRKKRYGRPDRRGEIKGRVPIDKRPEIVNQRGRVGDWEVDTVIGKRSGPVLVTLVERKTRFCVVAKSPNKTAKEVTAAIITSMMSYADHVLTLTYDNGKEFTQHDEISKTLGASGFFATPYCSWERGLNENTNGLIRQYFKKGFDLSEVTATEVKKVNDKLNNRPRKCLEFKTPNQLFCGINPPVALAS